MSKIRQSARGEPCLVRIPGVCNHNPETTVFAHLGGAGMGLKHPDCEGAYCCSSCHDVVDGRALTARGGEWDRDYVTIAFYEGCVRTRKKLIEKGLLVLR